MKIKLTPALKEYAIKNFGVKADANDARFQRVIGGAMLKGTLSGADYARLSGGTNAVTDPPPKKKATAPVLDQAAIDAAVDAKFASLGLNNLRSQADTTPQFLLSKSSAVQIRVKSAAENYSTSRKSAIVPERRPDGRRTGYKDAGQPVMFQGKGLDHPADLDKAVSQAYFKWVLSKQLHPGETPRGLRLTDHDRDLLYHAIHKMAWTGHIGGDMENDSDGTRVNKRLLNELERKTLLDDSVSGGIEVAPVVFDEAIILTPVLFGELFPSVKVININRGRRVHGAVMVNPTVTSGIAEGTAIQPFNTASFVTAFDNSIFCAVGAIEIGQDWEEDSPVDLGSSLIEQWGMKYMEWLDMVIAIGDGVTQPLGIFNTGTVVGINTDNGAGGPTTMSDLESLMFGVQKQFRNEPGAKLAYVMNDTMYRRCRTIPVGPGDERRILGYEEQDYELLETPARVNNFIQNGLLAYANLYRYRMYRRLGLKVRVETGGRTLALSNTKLIVLRARYGGSLELGGAAAVAVDGQI